VARENAGPALRATSGAAVTAAGGASPRRAPTRRTRQELRALLLDAGVEVLRAEGLGIGAEQLTFKRVFERVAATEGIRVTNASVIGRIWQNQAQFQSAVLAAMVTDEVTDQERAVLDATTALIGGIDRSSLDGRRAGLREQLRVAAEANLATGTTSRSWAVAIGVWALVSGSRGSASTREIYDALLRSYEGIERRSVAASEAMMAFFGLQLRHPLRVDQFASACTALVEGCALRDRADAGIRGVWRPTGSDGALQEWTVLGVGMEALVAQFFEFDPDWSPEPVS
jgi:hypothetical protein